ncbi:MAG: efflux RND transporter periplasmic adaptor subunit [Acidobacteriota bacterium]
MTERWKRTGPLAAGGVVLALLAAIGWFLWGGRAPAPAPEPPLIRTEPAGRADFVQAVPWLGRVESLGTVTVTAPCSARVIAVLARDGGRVRKGQPLFSLGGPLLQARLDSARAQAAALEREAALAREVTKRQEEAARLKIVDENAAARAESDQRRAEAELRQAEAELASLEAAATLRAPTAGVFTDRRANPGQDVEAGTPLAEITDPARLRIAATAYLPPGLALEGRPAEVSVEGGVVALTVVRVFPDQNPAGGTRLWLEGPGLDGRLGPGAEVSGTLAAVEHKNVLAVPRSAVVYDEQEKPYVFVERAGTYLKTPVTLGLASSASVEVASGLGEGDRVVVQGAYELFYRDFGKTYRVED